MTLDGGADHDGAGDDAEARMARRLTDAAEHVVQFYESDAFLIDTTAAFIGEALAAGGIGIVFVTPAHRAALDERLRRGGVDIGHALADERYRPFDAAATISRLAIDTGLEAARFTAEIGGVVARAAAGRPIRVFGELVALLAAEERAAAALRLEARWNALQQTIPFALLCGYPMACLNHAAPASLLDEVCAAHSRIVPAESYAAAPNADARLRAVAGLQHKALRLDAEIAAREAADARLRHALAAERAARRDAEAAATAREAFLSIAAHELRTPLTTLLGQSQLLLRRLQRDGRLEQARDGRALGAVAAQAGKLARLVNRLLDDSRLETGSLRLEQRPTDLTEIVARVVADARSATDRHVIAMTAPPSMRALVDGARLEQLLAHLLDNAMRYSPDGGAIEVSLSQPAPGVAELVVRDSGVGVAPDERDRIFDRFARNHAAGGPSGLGLGLCLSRQIVALHGGDMRVEFPADGGTRVVARLPLGLATDRRSQTDRLADIEADFPV